MAPDEAKDDVSNQCSLPPQSQAASNHILSLDLCRGLAAFVVLIYHINFLLFEGLTTFQRGYLCVDFFFILSGYVIASSYDARIASGFGRQAFLYNSHGALVATRSPHHTDRVRSTDNSIS